MNNLTIITIKEDHITDFSAVRNRALATAKTDWVLFLDSDETLSPALQAEIQSAIKTTQFSAYYLSRLDTFLGRELHHGENTRNRFLRLARHDWGQWQRPVHEVWVGGGRAGELTNPLRHQLPPIKELLVKINHYSTLEAQYRYKQGKHSSLLHLTVLPPAKFIQNYCLRLGFLDGVPGTIMAVLMSFHSFLTWTKLFLLQQKQS